MTLTKSDFIDIISELEINYVEFKVKEFEDFSRWEDLKPILFIPVINQVSADTIARKFIQEYRNIREVRWNFIGNPQGHYFQQKFIRKST